MKINEQINTDTTLTFTNWANQQLEMQLQQLQQVESSSGKQLIVLKATTTPLAMGQLLDEQWFHYDDYVMLHDINFNEQQPITVTLVLSQAIAESFITAEVELDQVLFSLLDLEHKGFAAINNGEFWFLTDAAQEIELPTALVEQGGSSLKQGFKTVWYNELLQQPLHERKLKLDDYSSLTLMEQVIQYLELHQYTWELYNEEIIQITLPNSQQTWAELIRVDEQARTVLFYAVFPQKIPDESIQKLSYILLNENYNMISGAFELDLEDGELRYRSSLFAPEGVQQAAITHILNNHDELMKLYIPAIQKYTSSN